jgi:hypothetical protein
MFPKITNHGVLKHARKFHQWSSGIEKIYRKGLIFLNTHILMIIFIE